MTLQVLRETAVARHLLPSTACLAQCFEAPASHKVRHPDCPADLSEACHPPLSEMSFAMRHFFHALCLLQALTLGACATQPAPTSKQERPPLNRSATGVAAAKTPAIRTKGKSAKATAAAEKAAAAKAAAVQKAAADKAAAAERVAAAKAAAEAKAEAARVAAAAKADAAKAAAVAKADAAARAEAAARADMEKAAAAARAETVAKAEARARADAAARADAIAKADAAARANAEKAAAAAAAAAKADAAARANAVARAEAAARSEAAEKAAAPAEARRDYAVAGGDVLRISVYQSPDLSLDARVSESGTISYPLLGQLSVGGLSIPQVEATIARQLRDGKFIKQPQVSVLLSQVRGNQVSVLGMANRPGRYPIEVNGMLLSELLALAGGVAEGGSEIVTLSGTRDGKPFRQRVDVNALFANGEQSANPIVSSGDTLYIERLPNVYIYGEVQRPGPIPLMPDMTLMQAVASGGGLTDRGTERGMRVHRRDPSGETQVLQPTMDHTLQPGDVVYVRESLF
jgi:polysaccharide export outer membrane protein